MTEVTKTIIKIKADEHGGGKITILSPKRVDKVILTVSARFSDAECRFTFNCESGGDCLEFTDRCDFCVCFDFKLEEALAWSVSAPNLYNFSTELTYEDGEQEDIIGSFGCRSIAQNGKNVCLNGTPIFIRGYIRGATAHEHSNNCGLCKEDFYRKNIKAAKKFGFNLVRFHSVVPDEEFFKVADEEGMLVHIEMRLPDDIYNNLREMQTSGDVLVPDEYVESVVNKLYNHPSLCVYCIGNEIKDASAAKRIGEIYSLIRRLDDTRLFLDTCAWGANGRPCVDIDVQHMSYFFPYGKHADMYENTENLLVVGADEDHPLKTEGNNSETVRELHFNIPLIAHEVCHYTALRDFSALDEKFKKFGKNKPWWIDEELKMIKAKGYVEKYPEMYKASKSFQFECWKVAFEAMRASKLLGGFHFLQFADTDVYENSNGIVDCFDDENVVSSEGFLRFNGDRVLLCDLKTRNYFADTTLTAHFDFSNCGEDSVSAADFAYRLCGKGGNVYAEGSMKNLDVSKKGLYGLCTTRIRLPKVEKSEELALYVSLRANGEIYSENKWKIWVYKAEKAMSYAEFVNYSAGDAFITDDIEKALKLLNTGKKVCLIYRSDFTRHVEHKKMSKPKYAFKASWNRFKPVIWDRGTNYGGIFDCDKLNKFGFAAGRYYDFNMSALTEDSDKIILDDFPVAVESIMSGIDKSCRDRFDAYKDCFNMPELEYERTLRDFSYMFEVAAGEGKLLVCGLNFKGLDENEPSARCMSEFVKKYIASNDFDPKNGITLDELKSYMIKCAEEPVYESIMTQFWELDDAPVESKTFWRESKAYLREYYERKAEK